MSDVEYEWNLYHDMDNRNYKDVDKIKELEAKLAERDNIIRNLENKLKKINDKLNEPDYMQTFKG